MTSSNESVERVCPHCGARLKTTATPGGKRLPCPRCKTLVDVPSPVEPPAEDDVDDVYAIAAPVDEPEVFRAAPLVDEPLEDDDREERPASDTLPSRRPPLPRHPMVQGVFAFLFQVGTLCWVFMLSVGWGVLAAMLARLLGLSGDDGLMSSLLVSILSLSVAVMWMVPASAFWLCVLQESAAGNRTIESWPEVVWMNWIGEALFVGMSFFGVVVVAMVAAWLVDGQHAMGISLAVSFYLLFPFLLLSTLETGSPLVPISEVVAKSLWVSRKAWMVFYLETALLVAVLGVTLWLAAVLTGRASKTAVDVVLYWGAAVLVVVVQTLYFRLLGRLAWVCAEESREPDEDEDEDFDEDEPDESSPEIGPTPVDDF